MKYETPKCECGKDLIRVEEIVYHHTTTITQKGELSKRVDVEKCASYGTSWLQCKDYNFLNVITKIWTIMIG